MPIKIVKLDKRLHSRADFDCGNLRVNQYLRRTAAQQSEVGLGACYVAVAESQPGCILGFYSLHSVHDTLNHVLTKMPKVPVGCILLGWMGVDEQYQGLGLGKQLLQDAFNRFLHFDSIFPAILVDPKKTDPRVVEFYKKNGFKSCDQRRYYIARKTILEACRKYSSGHHLATL